MKTYHPRFPLLATATLAAIVPLVSALAGVMIEDDFTTSAPGAPAEANVEGRQPTKGPSWEGSAQVEKGSGLVADQEQANSASFSEIDVPNKFNKLIVKIRFQPGSEQQLAFGFANDAKALRDVDGRNNHGLMWVNILGKRANVIAGKYSSGDKIEKLAISSSSNINEMVELEFSVENQGIEAFLARLVANGKELAAQEIVPTEQPAFRYFFIQFRGEDEKRSNAVVEKISVEFE